MFVFRFARRVSILTSIVIIITFILIPKHKVYDTILMWRALRAVEHNEYGRAETIYRKILSIDPRNARAYRGLGSINLLRDNDPKQAIQHHRKAVELGDMVSLPMLAYSYLSTKQNDAFTNLIPSLMIVRKQDHDALECLLIYSLNTKDKDLFLKSISDLSEDYIQIDNDSIKLIARGREYFSIK